MRHLLLGTGFRLFFLLGALAAVGLVPAWLYAFHHGVEELGLFPPLEWHRHEMLFGFTAAIVAGFLLTAVPNWCGTPHRRGLPILTLGLLWVTGRVAIVVPEHLPWGVASALDLAFLPALSMLLAPDLFRAGRFRNLVFLVVLGALTACNLSLHLGALGVWEDRAYAITQLSLDLIVVLMLVIGGRVIPYFTRKKLGVVLTEPAGLASIAHLALYAAILAEALEATGPMRAGTLALAAVFAAARMLRWQARGTWRAPLLWVLHLGYGWVVLGLLVKAASILSPTIHPRAAAHFLTVGGIGTLTIGMMSRVALGHTGRPIEASRTMAVAFGMMTLAAATRALVPMLWPTWHLHAVIASGALWTGAFLLYLWVHVPIFLSPRPDGRPA